MQTNKDVKKATKGRRIKKNVTVIRFVLIEWSTNGNAKHE